MSIDHLIKIPKGDMKAIIDQYVPERTYETLDRGDTITDQFKLSQYSNPTMIAGFLTVTYHKYTKQYTYQFSFYGFPQFKFFSTMESRIRLEDKFRNVY